MVTRVSSSCFLCLHMHVAGQAFVRASLMWQQFMLIAARTTDITMAQAVCNRLQNYSQSHQRKSKHQYIMVEERLPMSSLRCACQCCRESRQANEREHEMGRATEVEQGTAGQGRAGQGTLVTRTVPAVPRRPATPWPGRAQSSATSTVSTLCPSAFAHSAASPNCSLSPAPLSCQYCWLSFADLLPLRQRK